MTNPSNQTQSDQIMRPPVVVILGHVDHGKTSILDAIRSSKVAAKEAGGITQHVGAYQASHNDRIITFLDTPGHEAFTAIRSRGAKAADIAILVVAADEGVKPQTKEAIRIIHDSGVEYIVAINKIDKEGSNPQRVRQELAENEVLVEGYGGSVPVIELSAKTGKGLNDLLDMIILVADVQELKATPEAGATGVVVEAHKDAQRGQRATIIVQNGTLNIGDIIVAGTASCKVKAIENFLGKTVRSAGPSEPAVIFGWEGNPPVGAMFEAAKDPKAAELKVLAASEMGTKPLFLRAEHAPAIPGAQTKKTANLIIKADVFSSLEAIDHVISAIHSDEVTYKVTQYGVGSITTSDTQNARTTGATIIGFNVGVEDAAKSAAERDHIEIFTCSIIYELVEKVRQVMSLLLDPEIIRTPLGRVKVLALFRGEGKNQIVGGKVTQGKVTRGSLADVIRNNHIMLSGKLAQIQSNKQDVTEVREGQEFGMRFEQIKQESKEKPLIIRTSVQTVMVGDILEVYSEEKIQRSL